MSAIFQRLVGDVRLVVRLPRAPTAEEFDRHIIEAACPHRVTIVVAVGGGVPADFNAQQRAKLQRAGRLGRPYAVSGRSSSERLGP